MKDSQLKEALREVLIPQVLEEMPENIEEYEFSEEYKRKKEELLRSYGITNESGKRRKIVYRAASILLVVVTTLVLMTVSVRAFFPQIWQVFVDWFEDYAKVEFDGKHNDRSWEIEELMEPSYVPNGLKAEQRLDSNNTYFIEYSLDEVIVLQFSQKPSRSTSVLIDSSFDIETIDIYGYSGILGSRGFERIIGWDDDQYSFLLTFSTENITEEIAIKIAESVYSTPL